MLLIFVMMILCILCDLKNKENRQILFNQNQPTSNKFDL